MKTLCLRWEIFGIFHQHGKHDEHRIIKRSDWQQRRNGCWWNEMWRWKGNRVPSLVASICFSVFCLSLINSCSVKILNRAEARHRASTFLQKFCSWDFFPLPSLPKVYSLWIVRDFLRAPLRYQPVRLTTISCHLYCKNYRTWAPESCSWDFNLSTATLRYHCVPT